MFFFFQRDTDDNLFHVEEKQQKKKITPKVLRDAMTCLPFKFIFGHQPALFLPIWERGHPGRS